MYNWCDSVALEDSDSTLPMLSMVLSTGAHVPILSISMHSLSENLCAWVEPQAQHAVDLL